MKTFEELLVSHTNTKLDTIVMFMKRIYSLKPYFAEKIVGRLIEVIFVTTVLEKLLFKIENMSITKEF